MPASVQPAHPNSGPHPDMEPLRQRALASLQLGIELFNRPSEVARSESVLILLHHAFELLLKSVIVERTGTVVDQERGYSYGFDKCLAVAEQLKLITKDDRRFLSMLDNLRDSAVHYYQVVSEDMLYVFSQASATLFDRLIRVAVGQGLLDFLPGRVLPISARPPCDLHVLVEAEFCKLKQLLMQAGTSKEHAIAALRPLMAFSVGGEDEHRRMTPAELEIAVENLRTAETWRVVFPQIAKLRFSTEGDGIPLKVRVAKDVDTAMPVRVLKPGDTERPEGFIIHKEINILDKFNMGLTQLAAHLAVSSPRTLAMVCEHHIQDDSEAFRSITIGSSKINRYSKRALDILRGKLDTVEECWKKQREALTKRRRPDR